MHAFIEINEVGLFLSEDFYELMAAYAAGQANRHKLQKNKLMVHILKASHLLQQYFFILFFSPLRYLLQLHLYHIHGLMLS